MDERIGPGETYIVGVMEPAECEYVFDVCSRLVCPDSSSSSSASAAEADLFISPSFSQPTTRMPREKVAALAEEAREMFVHAYDAYMQNAFPSGELLPLSCKGAKFDLAKVPMVTLIDSLDTLAILGNRSEFRRTVRLVAEGMHFEVDRSVSVFEINIRVLGGLLSAHMLAVDSELGLMVPREGDADYAVDGVAPWAYRGELIALAKTLGDKLMPAFDTVTGIPYGTVNLKRGVPKGETKVASAAGGGSLSLEFSVLSVLTGDPVYGRAAQRASRELFDRRSPLGLVGKHIHTGTGKWAEAVAGIGSNEDSFYEYHLKMYLLFGEPARVHWRMFQELYYSVFHSMRDQGWYRDVDMGSAASRRSHFESLMAFWPGLQALVGELREASKSLNAFYLVWRQWGFIPEEMDHAHFRLIKGGASRYPLRPELIESTYLMHRASGDPSWLWAGADFMASLRNWARTPCGFASIEDVATLKQEDAMPSFFLAETLKYLYLLFRGALDDDGRDDNHERHFLHTRPFVFTTEAHPIPVMNGSAWLWDVESSEDLWRSWERSIEEEDGEEGDGDGEEKGEDEGGKAGGGLGDMQSSVEVELLVETETQRRVDVVMGSVEWEEEDGAMTVHSGYSRKAMETTVASIISTEISEYVEFYTHLRARTLREDPRRARSRAKRGEGGSAGDDDGDGDGNATGNGGDAPLLTRPADYLQTVGTVEEARIPAVFQGVLPPFCPVPVANRRGSDLLSFLESVEATAYHNDFLNPLVLSEHVCTPNNDPDAAENEEGADKEVEVDAGKLGKFAVKVFSDGFHVQSLRDGENMEISNVGGELMFVRDDLRGDVRTLLTQRDGTNARCFVQLLMERATASPFNPELPSSPLWCSVAAFGPTADSSSLLSTTIAEPELYESWGSDPFGCQLLDRRTRRVMEGKIAVVARGKCMFEEKARNMQRMGAVAVVMINSAPQRTFVMAGQQRVGEDGEGTKRSGGSDLEPVTIPTVMITPEDGGDVRDVFLARRAQRDGTGQLFSPLMLRVGIESDQASSADEAGDVGSGLTGLVDKLIAAVKQMAGAPQEGAGDSDGAAEEAGQQGGELAVGERAMGETGREKQDGDGETDAKEEEDEEGGAGGEEWWHKMVSATPEFRQPEFPKAIVSDGNVQVFSRGNWGAHMTTTGKGDWQLFITENPHARLAQASADSEETREATLPSGAKTCLATIDERLSGLERFVIEFVRRQCPK